MSLTGRTIDRKGPKRTEKDVKDKKYYRKGRKGPPKRTKWTKRTAEKDVKGCQKGRRFD